MGKSGSKEKFHPFYLPTDLTTCVTVYGFTVYLPWLGFQRWKWLCTCSVLICQSNRNSEPNISQFITCGTLNYMYVSNASMKCILIFYEFDLQVTFDDFKEGFVAVLSQAIEQLSSSEDEEQPSDSTAGVVLTLLM